MAQATKAVLPRQAGGAWAKRLESTVAGAPNEALIATAYMSPSVDSSELNRYTLVCFP
jgi:hypothetical protein